MYSCQFNDMSDTAVSISISSFSTLDVKIKNSQFISCNGAIRTESEKYSILFDINGCLFEQCQN